MRSGRTELEDSLAKELEGKKIGMAAGLGVAIAVGNMAKQCELGLRCLAAV